MGVRTFIFFVLVYACHVSSTSPPIEENCDHRCGDPNEVFRKCAPTCPPGTCDVLWKNYTCPPPCKAAPCKPGCVCRDGYLWNVNKVCVTKKDCLRCQGPNEYWDCGPPCDNRCDNLGDECHNVNSKCTYQCYCMKGFARNKKGVCIPEKDCTPRCGPNEHWHCGPPCDRECPGNPVVKSCGIVDKKCTNRCYCNKGYVRDHHEGTCIPENECPPKCTGLHEHYENCGTACPKTCRNMDVSVPCPDVCVKGCFCDTGYVRNPQGICVSPENCVRCKNPNEVFDCRPSCDTHCVTLGQACPIISYMTCNERYRCGKKELPGCVGEHMRYTGCGSLCPLTCSNYDKNIVCAAVCVEGCFCEAGYVLDDNGKCVLPQDCIRCGPNEHKDCGPVCDRECPGALVPEFCSVVNKKCTNRCYCNKGYVRDHNGQCIPEHQCPPKCVRPHEHYSNCGSACPKTCRNYNVSIACIALCVEGCFCDPGYVRDFRGNCVLPSECFKCPGPHEIFGCGSACDVTCATLGQRCPIINIVCNDRCYCDRGYARDKNNICIPIKHCPVKPHCEGENEEFLEAGTACPDTCRNYNLPDRVCPAIAVSGCFCKKGYVRNHENKCVRPCDCFKCRGPHEVFDCGSACDTTCATLGQTCPIINIKCNDKCYCEEGFARNKIGICIPINECKEQPHCSKNEVFHPCPPDCYDESCDSLTRTADCIQCPPVRCVPRCVCKKGFLRNHEGKCVPINQCFHECGPDEVFDPCPPVCDTRTCEAVIRGINCLLLPSQKCYPACVCKNGLYRNGDGRCVTISDCLRCKRPNEVFYCGSACDTTCATLGQVCPIINIKCNEMCYCRNGYARDCNGVCIPIDQCPPEPHHICGVNERYTNCGTACPDTCDNYNIPDRLCTLQCVSGCFCVPGFVRNNKGVCVPSHECPSKKCGKNEIYDVCGTACPRTCDNLFVNELCIDVCVEGCFCAPGYVRNQQKQCVKPEHCPPKTCSFNEVFECPTCPARTCHAQDNPYACAQGVAPLPPCRPECVCRKGFLKNNAGVCVIAGQCHPQKPCDCKANEVYKECGSMCPETCNNRGLPRPCTKQCVAGCFCRDGLIWNDDGICVEPKDCNKRCGKNEVFAECQIICPPQVCESLFIRYMCAEHLPCIPGCNCLPGFLRDHHKVCIPSEHCPGLPVICSDTEEYLECGPACPATCEDPLCERDCIHKCVAGCFCRKGLVRNHNGECVHPSQCHPPQCGINEIWDCETCPPRTCEAWCEETPRQCPATIDGKLPGCKPQCVCEPGFRRNCQGECVIEHHCCPLEPCDCEENEVFLECGTACPDTCFNAGWPRICTDQCVRGCFCKPGYIRGPFGCCIRPQYCPGSCGEHETYSTCGTPYPDTCADYWIDKPGTDQCVEGCFCDEGYVRRADGKCVKPKHCTICADYEVAKTCGHPNPDTCWNFWIPKPGTDRCIIGCFCTKGRVRDIDGRCVSIDECPPPQCGINEIWDCETCPPRTCEAWCEKTPRQCPATIDGKLPGCKPQCVCEPGFRRNCQGQCVIEHHCCPLEPCDCEENEVFLECGTACPETCFNVGWPRICTDHCVRGCFCKPGYIRGPFGCCIRPQYCPGKGHPECGLNEFWTPDSIVCPPQTCESIYTSYLCEDRELRKPVPGCDCRNGYLRNKQGICIPSDQCPPPGSCGEHETYSTCGTPYPDTCADYWLDKPGTDQCVEGCFCDEGYVRRADGNCVKPEHCTICAKYEVAKTCGHPHPDTCWNFWIPKPGTDRCIIGCFCTEGRVRDYDGRCVLIDECPKVCQGLHEVWSENTILCPPQVCSSLFREYDCPEHPPHPLPGCICEEGFLRDDESGICIPIQECKTPPPQCGINEIWDCETCPPRTCEAWCEETPRQCPATIDGKLPGCKPQCVCEPGFRRNCQGQCVIEHLCCPQEPCDCVENEVFLECGTACPDTCFNFNITRICTYNCVRGCFCEEGFIRGPDGCCIKHKHCHSDCPNMTTDIRALSRDW